MTSTCTICNQYVFHSQENYWAQLYGQKYGHKSDIIRETAHFLVIAGIGALTRGYVLLFPKQHISSIGALPEYLFSEVRNEQQIIREALLSLYGSAVFFEHGSSSSCTYGSCIEHAHLHALPSAVDFKWFVTEFTETPIQDISELQEYCDNGYLYYENAEGAKLVYTTDIPIGSQYFRRIWAQTVDKEDEWDWQVFIGEEDVASTIGDLREVLSMQENGDNEED